MSFLYGVATVSRNDYIIGLFSRILSLLQGSFAKETYNLIDPINRSHPIGSQGNQCPVWHIIVDWSCHTHEWVMLHTWMSHVTHMNESCHTDEWVMSHRWMDHITHMTHYCKLTHYCRLVVSHTWLSHATYMNESCHTHEWVMSHIWMDHITHITHYCN